MSSSKKTTKASTKKAASSSSSSSSKTPAAAAKAGAKRQREPKLAPEPMSVDVEQDLEMSELPEAAPPSLPLEHMEFPDPEEEPTPMEMEVDEPPAAKKRKISNKQRKINTIAVTTKACDNLRDSIQKDLDDKKFDKELYAERAARKYKKELIKISKNLARLNQDNKPAVRNGKSGFEQPYGLTPELAAFFGWEADATKSRIEINTALCKYIREQDLQNPENRRMIQPNPALIALLGLPNAAEFNYAQMQRLYSHLLVPLHPTPEDAKQ